MPTNWSLANDRYAEVFSVNTYWQLPLTVKHIINKMDSQNREKEQFVNLLLCAKQV